MVSEGDMLELQSGKKARGNGKDRLKKNCENVDSAFSRIHNIVI